jgi:DNA topoisomerase-1
MKITAKITSHSDWAFTYDSEAVEFLGWKIVSGDTSDDKAYHLLQTIRSIEKYNRIAALCVYSHLKAHLTEAKLVNLLEDKGIGRPSTFASLVDKIQERVYVKKDSIKGRSVTCKDYELIDSVVNEIETTREVGGESNKLIIQQVGLDVIAFLYKNFAELFDYDYTQRMEKDLDLVSHGEKVWTTLCDDCVQQLDTIINKYKGENPNNEICIGKFEGHDLILKKGKFGLYANWGANNKSLKEFGNRPLENITFDEVEQVLVKNNTNQGR